MNLLLIASCESFCKYGETAATSWSCAAYGTTKPIPQTPPPARNLSTRNGAAAGAIPTNSPSVPRSAPLWFPKPSTISRDSDWCCPYRQVYKQIRNQNLWAPLKTYYATRLLRWAVLEILMYSVYIPVSPFRPPCTRTAHHTF